MHCSSVVLLLGFASVLGVDARKECVGHQGKDTLYCVCNGTYCDDLPALSKQNKGSALVYETSKSGKRFKESQLTFVKSDGSHANDHIVVAVDRKERHQKWYGLGAAFTDAAVGNIDALPKDMAENIIKDYFGSTGAEFSLARVPIGATDFSARHYTYDDSQHEDFDLKNWKLQDEDVQHKIPNIKLAQKLSPHKIKLFGSPWFQPDWLNNKTQLKTQPDKNYGAWAQYLIKFLDAYNQAGVRLWGMTVQNEPDTFANYQMGWNDPKVERDFVSKHLGPALEKAGYTKDKFNLMVFDDGPDNGPDNYKVRFNEVVLSDAGARKYINGVAYHCYGAHDLTWISDLKKKYPEMFVVMTECCENFTKNTNPPTPVTLGYWDYARDYTEAIMHNINTDVVGWTEWNLALDTLGHPNHLDMSANAPVIIDQTKKEYYKNPNFYALGHYSKFIAPDSQKVALKPSHDFDKWAFNAAAFERPDNSTAIIAYNLADQPVKFVIRDELHGDLVTSVEGQTIQSYIYWH